jgi:hypothetical protein
MSQILHIFRKDVRHHWPEILLSFALLGVYAWLEPRKWVPEGAGAAGEFPLLILIGKALPWLIPIAWCLLIVRVVQGESLVGDRQFWVTRPYQWPKLLASKILFFITFVNIPLFIVDVILLHRGGFAAWPRFPGLLFMQLLLIIFLILPASAAAAITSSVGQVFLLALGISLYLIGVAYLSSIIPNSGLPDGWNSDVVSEIVFVGLCVSLILLQYARRKTMQSRILLCCSGAIIAILAVIPSNGSVQAYPLPATEQQYLAQFAFDTKTAPDATGVPLSDNPKYVVLLLPLEVSGIAEGYVIQEKGVHVNIESPDGLRWSSRWTGAYSLLWPNQDKSTIDLSVDKNFVERVKSSPVNLHISIALAQYRQTNERTVVATWGQFPVPDFGSCSIGLGFGESLNCRSALKTPAYLARIERAHSTCPPEERKNNFDFLNVAVASGGDWNESSPAELGIDPVVTSSLYFSAMDPRERQYQPPRVCSGTPVTFHTPEFSQQSRAEFDIKGIRLDEYGPKPLVFTQ